MRGGKELISEPSYEVELSLEFVSCETAKRLIGGRRGGAEIGQLAMINWHPASLMEARC